MWPKYLFLSCLPLFASTLASLVQAQTATVPDLAHSASLTNPQTATSAALGLLALDKDGKPITDLKAEDLRVHIKKEDRKVLSLSAIPETPKTIGLFFDISGSRRSDSHINKEIQAAASFLQSVWREGDDAFVMAFGSKLFFVARPSKDLKQIVELLPRVADATYYGSTALYDALCGVQLKKEEGARREKLYVILSDFEDNTSKNSATDAIHYLIEEGVRLFPLLLGDDFGSSNGKRIGKRSREAALELAEHTGGEVLAPSSERDLNGAFVRIGSDLRGAYWMEYEPPPGGHTVKDLRVDTSRSHARLLYAHD